MCCLLAATPVSGDNSQVRITLTIPKNSFAPSEKVVIVAEIHFLETAHFNPFIFPGPYAVSIYDQNGRRLEPRRGPIIEVPWRSCNYSTFRAGTRLTIEIPLNGDAAQSYFWPFEFAPGRYCVELTYNAQLFAELPAIECPHHYRNRAFVPYAKSNPACFEVVATPAK
jgi:hypothetical protein